MNKLFCIIALIASLAVPALALSSEECNSFLARKSLSESALINLTPSSLDSSKIKSSIIKLDLSTIDPELGTVNARLIEPGKHTATNKLALDLHNIETSLIITNELPFTGLSATNVIYIDSKGSEIISAAVILKPNAFHGAIIEHEIFHAQNYYLMKHDFKTTFDGEIEPSSYFQMIQPKWKDNVIYKRITGEKIRGVLLREKFSSAYEAIPVEEVKTFVTQLSRRTFESNNPLKLLSEAEMGGTLIPAEFFIRNFSKYAQISNDELEKLVNTSRPSEMLRKIIFQQPKFTLPFDPRVIKREIGLAFDSFIYTFENIPQSIYKQVVEKYDIGDLKQIPELVLPFMRKKLKQQALIAKNIEKKFDNYLEILETLKEKNTLTQSEHAKLQKSIMDVTEYINSNL